MLNVALLDDYAGVARSSADWGQIQSIAQIATFAKHLSEQEAASALASFDVLCTIRERMALPATLLAQLPRLKLITIIGMSLTNLDMDAATAHGVLVVHPGPPQRPIAAIANATPELTWGLVIATVRHLALETRAIREGGWQTSAGSILAGRTLGLLGLGRIGKRVAEYGRVFGMDVIAWSQNLTAEASAAIGVRRVAKDELFAQADVLSVHVQLSDRTRGLVGARELALMKSSAYLINTSRGPIVDELALIETLRGRRIAGAGLDVFDEEPLPTDHPFRQLDNVTATPHLGYATHETLASFYADNPAAIAAFARGAPIRVINKAALDHDKQAAFRASLAGKA